MAGRRKLLDSSAEYEKLLPTTAPSTTLIGRRLSPIQTARAVHRVIEEEGMETACEALFITRGTARSLAKLFKIPEQFQDAIVWGTSRDFGVGYSVALRISSLDEKDQIVLLSEAANHNMATGEVDRIIEFYRESSGIPLGRIIESMTGYGLDTMRDYMAIIPTTHETHSRFYDRAAAAKKGTEALFEELAASKLGARLGVRMLFERVAMWFSEPEYKKYKKKIAELGLEDGRIAEYLLE